MSNGTGGFLRGKAPMVVGAVLVGICVVVLVVVAANSLTGGGPGGGRGTIHYYCSNEECGYEWDGKFSSSPTCPECGSPAYTVSYFKCPRCQEVFAGLDTMQLGQHKFRYRVHGTKEWQNRTPRQFKCPNCQLEGGMFFRYPVNPDGTPIGGGEGPGPDWD